MGIYRPKTILVTGGAGFIGHHLIDYIIKNTDYNVVSLDRLDYSGNLNRLDYILKDASDNYRVKIVFHDLKAEISPFVAKAIGEIDIILHLAAASHVDRSIEDPLSFVMDNVVGTCNLLNYARTLPRLDKFLYFSTDEVFGPAPIGVNYKERDRYNSTNPYSATKAGAEELCVAFANTYGIPVVITHTMNVIGERQHPEKFIPMCIRKILTGEEVLIHANKDLTKAGSRFYIHAQDVAKAILFILDSGNTPGLYGTEKTPKYNIVGERELDNLTLAQTIADTMGYLLSYKMVDFHSSRPGHDLRYSLDGSLLASLGWKPSIPIHEHIKGITQWYMDNLGWLWL